jgi:hypothetical protein
MRTASHADFDFDPREFGRGGDGEDLAARAFADRDPQAAQFGRSDVGTVLDDQTLAPSLARRDVDLAPDIQIDALERLDRRIAPGLVSPGG